MADLYGDALGGGLTGNIDSNRKVVSDVTAIDFYGNRPLTFFTIDFVANASAETNENEAIKAALDIVQKYATIVIRGDLFDSNTQMCLAVEQTNQSLNWDGNGAETLVEQIEDEIIALGATYGNNSFDMTAVTCTVKTSLAL